MKLSLRLKPPCHGQYCQYEVADGDCDFSFLSNRTQLCWQPNPLSLSVDLVCARRVGFCKLPSSPTYTAVLLCWLDCFCLLQADDLHKLTVCTRTLGVQRQGGRALPAQLSSSY